MDILSNYKSIGEPWTKEEDEELNKLYNIDMLDIIEISKINNRAPGSIISRLCKNNYITIRTSARGYIQYKNSDLYKSIVARGEHERKIKEENKKEKIKPLNNITRNEYIELQKDIKEMKTEIFELKNMTKELVGMMKAVYEFEDSQN